MDINKGLNTDIQPINLPSGSWIKAKNVIRQKGKGIQTHIGFNDLGRNLDGNIIGTIEIKSISIIFSVYLTPTLSFFEIGKLESDNYDIICRTEQVQYLNIDETSQFTGTYTYNYKGEILISFFDWAKRGRPFLLNINHLPFELSGALIQAKPDVSIERTLELMYLQPKFITPFINLEKVTNGGNNKCGVYQICIAYEIADFDFTAPSLISEPIYLGEHEYLTNYVYDNKFDDYKTILYNSTLTSAVGEYVSKTMEVKISNLDRTYKRFKLIILFKTGESSEAYTSGIYTITDDFILIKLTGQEEYSENYEAIVLGRARFANIGAMTNFQNKLCVSDIAYLDNTFDYQTYADNIKLKLYVEPVPLNDYDSKIGYQNTIKLNTPKLIWDNSTFAPDEVYAYYIAFGIGDIISKSYHLRGRAPKELTFSYGSEPDYKFYENKNILDSDFLKYEDGSSVSAEFIEFNKSWLYFSEDERSLDKDYIGYYQLRSTGELGANEFDFWENQDEYYEGTTTKVRHHKMPSLRRIRSKLEYGIFYNYKLSVGFNLSTLNTSTLPEEITSVYDTIYLLYADRTYNESTVIGMSPILSDRVGFCQKGYNYEDDLKSNKVNLRFYDYGLNTVKPTINPTHLQSEYYLVSEYQNTIPPQDTNATYDNNLDVPYIFNEILEYPTFVSSRIDSYNYFEEGDSSKTPKNILDFSMVDVYTSVNRESVLNLYTSTNNSITEDSVIYTESGYIYYKAKQQEVDRQIYLKHKNFADPYGQATLLLGTLKSFKQSVYVNYRSKNLILANSVSTSGINGLLIEDVSTSDIKFTGDSFVNTEFFRTKVNYRCDPLKDNFGFIQPEYTGSYLVTSIGYSFTNYSRINSSFKIDKKSYDEIETLTYNSIFSLRNSINLFETFNPEIINVNRIRTRFSRSVVLGTESKELGWRNFNVEEYFDFPTNAGDGVYLHGGELALLFGFSNDMYVAEIKETLDTGGGQTLSLKTNNLFDVSPNRIQDVFDRSVQILNRDNIFITKYGFVFYDYINKTIYLFDGKSQPLAISKLGIEDYIKSFTNVIKLTGGYDETTDHVFMTLLTTNNDWTTFSFYPTEKQFVSTYNFQLDNYFLNSGLLYGYTNLHGNGEVVRFNSGNPANYFTVQFKSIIDLVFSDIPNLSKILESVIWNDKLVWTNGTETEASNVDHTITDIIIYNDFGCSVSRPFTDKIKYINGNWHYNSITNSKLTSRLNSNPFTTDDELNYHVMDNTPRTGNSPAIVGVMYYVEDTVLGVNYNGVNYMTGSKFTAITPAMINLSQNSICYSIKKWFEKSNIICKFAVIRIVLNDASEQYKQVFLNDVIINYSKSI